jgi:hypothetical protein
MEGGYSQRQKGEEMIEKVMRGILHSPSGLMKIQRLHVNKAVATNKGARAIGARRADKVWGWVAREVQEGRHALKDKSQWSNEWLSDEEKNLLRVRADAAWHPGDQQKAARAGREEVVGAVRVWLQENEEPARDGPVHIRPQKLAQLHSAKKDMVRSRGGRSAIYAAIVLLAAEGEAVLTQQPQRRSRQGEWREWIPEMVDWMVAQQWVQQEEAAQVKEKATQLQQEHQQERRPWVVVDIGEGWRGVGRAISEELPEAEVVGVDRRGFTNTGALHGTIISAVHHEFQADTKEDVIKAVERKVGRSMDQWLMVWLSPECSPHSIANAMNQPKGAAHGEWAATRQNQEASSAQRQELEGEYHREAVEGTRRLLEGLEAHPRLRFALENPWTSRIWQLPEIQSLIQRNPTWRKERVDQCAYGRKSQKPTGILTNVSAWRPEGNTQSSGRCAAGRCAGTLGNAPGDTRHAEQTVPNSKDRRPDQGALIRGKREFTREAVVNAVAPGLVREIVRAALGDGRTLKPSHRRNKRKV